jgi:FkbM family methyltransferase
MIRYLIAACVFQVFAFAGYHSQVGQDQFINETFFKNFRNGIFVDVGAHNGIALSNTYFFEKELNWRGLCLEPNPEVFPLLTTNRSCLCICGCATTEHNVTKQFLKISGSLEMLSGLIDKFDDKHKMRIERQLKEFGGSYEVIDVKCYNLNQLLENSGIQHVHLLSLDTEGGEYEILENFDFTKCQIDVITVEDNYGIHPFAQLLENRGFRFVKSLEQDLIFINNNSSWILPND